MGASPFNVFVEGQSDAQLAFDHAVKDAKHLYGNRGYTGTIAEKEYFEVITEQVRSKEDAVALADQLMDAEDERIENKWGPAGAISIPGGWLFFGWASD